jgi:hypothetical protein
MCAGETSELQRQSTITRPPRKVRVSLRLSLGCAAGTEPLSPGKHQVRAEFAYDGGGLAKGGGVTRSPGYKMSRYRGAQDQEDPDKDYPVDELGIARR